MAGNRTYNRDSRGRFASGGGGGGSGGGGGKSKASAKKPTSPDKKAAKGASTRAQNTARANALKAKGTVSLGDRIKPKGFSGGKAAQARAGGLKKRPVEAAERVAQGRSMVSVVGSGTKAAKRSAIQKAMAMRSKKRPRR